MLAQLGAAQVRNFVHVHVQGGTLSAVEVVSAVDSMSPKAAALVPKKNRTSFERVLTTEFAIVKDAVH